MGNMCQENRTPELSIQKQRSRKTILSTIGTSVVHSDDYEHETDDIREFLTLTSQNTPSYEF